MASSLLGWVLHHGTHTSRLTCITVLRVRTRRRKRRRTARHIHKIYSHSSEWRNNEPNCPTTSRRRKTTTTHTISTLHTPQTRNTCVYVYVEFSVSKPTKWNGGNNVRKMCAHHETVRSYIIVDLAANQRSALYVLDD